MNSYILEMKWLVVFLIFAGIPSAHFQTQDDCDPATKFRCVDTGECILARFKCDSVPDCKDGSDEPPDCRQPGCKNNEHECTDTKKCVPRSWLCDKENDCGFSEENHEFDTSDEKFCYTRPFTCPPNTHKCVSNETCLPIVNFCDGKPDCPDGSDEGYFCSKNESMKCAYHYKNVNEGVVCYCPSGQRPTSAACVDIDECVNEEICDQFCVNKAMSFNCKCAPGYDLTGMDYCRARNVPADEEASMFISTLHSVNRIYMNGSTYPESNITVQTFSISFNHRNRSACFVHPEQGDHSHSMFTCVHVDNFSNRWNLPPPNLFSFEPTTHITLDWISGNWYFMDDIQDIIYMCTSDMRYCVILVDSNIGKPRGFAIDPTKGYMFFTKWGSTSPSVERTLLNGKEQTTVTTRKIVYPNGITLDFPVEHIYWVDLYLDVVQRVSYDGTNRKSVQQQFPASSAFALTLFERNLFVASLKKSNILRIGKHNMTDYGIVVGNLSRQFSIEIFHRQRQPEADHPCKTNNGECQQICVPLWQNKTIPVANCMCQPGYKLTASGKCIVSHPQSFLLYGKGKPAMIKAISIPAWNSTINEEVIPPIPNVPQPTLDYDVKTQFIYFSNNQKHVIERRRIDNLKQEVIVKTNISNCKGLAVDWIGRNLYWTDEDLGTITVARIADFNKRKTLIKDKRCHPRSIALDPLAGFMYWSNWSRTGTNYPGAIERAFMDGENRTLFVSNDLRWPNGLTIDFLTKRLYWCDSFRDKIERIDLSGSNRQVVTTIKINHPYGLTILNDIIFWTEQQQGVIKSYNTNSKVSTIIHTENSPLFDLKAFDDTSQLTMDIESFWCTQNGKCNDLCLSTPNSPKCVCRDGYLQLLDHNNTKCVTLEEKQNTTAVIACANDMFRCIKSGECVPNGAVCDGTADCSDASDEDFNNEGICGNKTCGPDEFRCDSNHCIPNYWICDGEGDCADESDELPELCEHKSCGVKQFICKQSHRCIPLSWVCDTDYDCGKKDSSDEEDCEKKGCSPLEFACRNGNCISMELVCNGENDCHDCDLEGGLNCDFSSDEDSCKEICRSTEFYCHKDDKCLSKLKQCDGVMDCSDNSDEQRCTHSYNITTTSHSATPVFFTTCESHEFRCEDGVCIRKSFVCDGYADCLDGSDERNCTRIRNCVGETCKIVPPISSPAIPLVCNFPHRFCDNNTVCITPEKLCDDRQDCVDGSDEGLRCYDRLCEHSADCSDHCFNAPEGFICSCPSNLYLTVENECSDKHRCFEWGICSQNCATAGNHSHRCYCNEGYGLEPDHFTCKSTDGSPAYIIFSNRHELRSIDLHTSSVKTLTLGLKNTVALDFYYYNGTNILYWTDVWDDKIFKGTIDDSVISNMEVVVKSGLATAEGLAVDWIGQNLYWVESNLDQIEVSRLNGSFRRTLIAGDIESPRAIAVDPRDGWLFWTDWDTKAPRIERSSMSGDHRSIIVRVDEITEGQWPNGLTLDYQMRRIYWIDAKSHAIFTVTYSGDSLQTVIQTHHTLDHPFAISLFENNIYWTDWRSNSVIRANKWNATDVSVIQHTLTQPFDIKIMHPSRQPAGKNPCAINNGNCTHLCLINIHNTYKCACPHIMVLARDNFTCIENEVFLLFSRPNEIRGADLIQPYYHTIPTISTPSVISPIVVDFFSPTKHIYWIDSQVKEVKRTMINGSFVESIIDTGINTPSGLAIDWISQIMFISMNSDQSSDGASKIVVCNLKGEYFTTVFSSQNSLYSENKVTSIKSLAVRPATGNLYFSVMYTDGHHSILSSNENGTLIITLTSFRDNSELLDPISLTVDNINHCLYWVNRESKTIQVINLRDHALHTVELKDGSSPTAVVVYKDLLYYADSGDYAIYSIDRNNGSYLLFRNNTVSVNSLIMYDPKLQVGTNACAKDRGNCSHLCIPVSNNERVCRCAIGYFNDVEDHTKCIGIKEFILVSINWEIKGIPLDLSYGDKPDVLAPISHILSASSVDFLAREDYIYWADGDHGTITRIKRDGSGRQVIVGYPNRDNTQTDWLAGIAVDWIAGNIYWTDPRMGVIEVSRLDGSYRHVLISNSLEKPTSIAVDPVQGLLFWCEVGSAKRITRATLNGGSRFIIMNETKGIINDITLDYSNKILYWCESNGLYSVRYDGNDMKFLFNHTSATNPFGLVVYDERIFWIDIVHNRGSLNTALIDNLSNYTEILNGVGDSLRHVKIYTKNRQLGTNPCAYNNGGCKELCLFDGLKPVCVCSYGLVSSDGKSCKQYDSFIMYSRVDHIDSIHISDANDLNPPFPSIRSKAYILNTIGLTFDYNNSLLFYSDIQRGSINSVFFNGTGHRIIADHLGLVEGISYDNVDNIIYWTCNSNASISRLNLTGVGNKKEVVVSLSEHDKPRGIDVDSCGARVYWTNWNAHQPCIQRSYISGFQPESIIKTDIRMPNALTLDHLAQKLYWADARLDKIERCEYDGTHRTILNQVNPQHVFDMAIYGDYLFWTDWVMQSVMRCNKYTGDETVVLRKNVPRPMGIVAVDINAKNCLLNKCRRMNGGCDDICALDEKGAVICSCRENRVLMDDSHRCKDFDQSSESPQCNANNQFKCSSIGCVNYSDTCDGVPNCPDASDEDPKYCVRRKCRPGYFKCDQNRCFENELKCNSKTDCTDGTDELGCPCSFSEYTCGSGECVSLSALCDQISDCHDGSDEKDCGENFSCTEGRFKCANGRCIPQAWVCDHDNDCEDNSTATSFSSDEKDCNKFRCSNNQIKCENEDSCILKPWRCDGISDCSNGSDEKNCNATICTQLEFRCNISGQCIPWSWVCDKEPDCTDGSDESVEQDCIDPLAASCSPVDFRCHNNKCILSEYFCDGDDDCDDDSDEPDDCRVCNSEKEFTCHNHRQCIPSSMVCDGNNNCGDNSDENLDNHYPACAARFKNATCNINDSYQCENYLCINESLICNGVNDCGDNSDEIKCNINECAQDPPPCQNNICVDKKIGYECQCPTGFQLHSSKTGVCVDTNECKAPVKPCSQVCVNEKGSYHCQCTKGYILMDNKYTCKASSDILPKLLFTNKHYIRESEFDGRTTLRVHNLTNTVGVDYEWSTQCLYWSEVSVATKSIRRICPGNATYQTLHGTNIENADGISVDWVAHNLYWCDKEHDRIEVSRLDGKYRKILINDKTILQEPRAIALDAIRGYMYWTDWGHKPYIGKAGMDGSDVRILINDTLGWPNALTISLETNELFWGDAKLDYISVADLDGKNRQIIISRTINPSVTLHHIFALAVFEDWIFWTDWETETIERCNKYTGQDCSTVTKLVHRPMDLRILHPYKQPEVPNNPCENNGHCSALCLLRPKGGRVCACPDGFILGSDNTSCVSNCPSSHFVCENTYKCIPMWWKCDNQDDCGDGWDEPKDCPEFKCIPGQYQCNNGQCIHPVLICDGKSDCIDHSDENNCDLFTCLDDHFKCSGDGTQKAVCIPNSKKCNGRIDCPNGEDEANCLPKTCLETQFKCNKSGICIPLVHACDGDNDCVDGSDELNCESRTCPSGSMQCKNGRCIPETWICDGQPDCTPDGEDEVPCKERTCDPTYFKCDNNKCIPGRWKCDYRDDCGDSSDERNCVYRNCSESEFRCGDGRCIQGSFHCDGHLNCADESDEVNCTVTCRKDEFRCHYPQHCISLQWRCDGDEDCLDGSDESHCQGSCAINQFKCGTDECIADSWICDGEKDCADGTDEKDDLCITRICPPSKFKCQNGKCISKSNVCNGKNNCGDNSDEDIFACNLVGLCTNGNFKCKNNHCISQKLVCDSSNDCGDNSDEEHCSMDDCPFGACSQICTMKKHGTHTCHCVTGYKTDPNFNRTCNALGRTAYLALALDGELDIINPYKKSYNLLKRITTSKPNSKIETCDILWAKDEQVSLYWANKHENAIWMAKILSYITDRESPEAVLLEKNYIGKILVNVDHHIRSISVDWLNKVVYWIESDETHNSISVANLKGQFRKTLFDTDLQRPRDLVVDPIRSQIYWSDCGRNARIEVAGADGTKRRTFVGNNIYWPTALSIDFPTKRLYWADSKLKLIECIQLNGTERNLIFQFPEGMKPYKIDVFEDFIYVALLQKNFVARIDKFGVGNITQIEGGDTKIADLIIYQEQKQINAGKPLEKSTYVNQSLCLGNPTGIKQACMCGDNFVMDHSSVGLECVCKLGWNGDNCDIPTNKCGICLNGGECDPQMLSRCKCLPGFTGLQCEQCYSLVCQNGGHCTKAPGGTEKCVCPNGYFGPICNASRCDNYCKQGSCVLSGDRPKCHCHPGYGGKKCDQVLCKDLCLHGGTCHVTSKNVSCSCPPTFTGRRCEVSICNCTCSHYNQYNNCISELPLCCSKRCTHGQCANGGTCHDIKDGSFCSCPYPWSGPDCSQKANSELETCREDFCKNGGLCLNNQSGPFCHCKSAWIGKRCTIYSRCINHCYNGGTCNEPLDVDAHPACTCPEGFEGPRCEDVNKKNEAVSSLPNTSTSNTPIVTSVNKLPESDETKSNTVFILLSVVCSLLLIFIGLCCSMKKMWARNQFMHMRIQENGAISNPMYLREELDDDERHMDHSLPLHEKASAFANPVYDSIYSVREGSSSANEEKKGLLEKNIEINQSLSSSIDQEHPHSS